MSNTEMDEIAPASPREIRIVYSGLMLVLSLGALDQSIVATALPRIVEELGGMAHLSWVVTAYVLASTSTTPIYGKLSDLYGRKLLIYVAIGIFLLGSILSGLAQNMAQLIVFRAIQGLGAGGLLPLAQITIGDIVAPRDRGKYQGFIGAAFAVCSVAGPVLGGVITDLLSWHWIFYVNLPLGAAALAFIHRGLRRPQRLSRRSIDYAGAVLLAMATTALLLVLSLGGSSYGWLSPTILGLAALAVTMAVLFGLRERSAREPIMPLHLYRNPSVAISWAVLALTFMAMLGAGVFFPLFFQLVLGVAPSRSGLLTAPMMVGIVTSSIIGGRLVSRTGRYKRYPVVGLGVAALCFAGLGSGAKYSLGLTAIEPTLVLLGLGLGLVMPNLTVAMQNAAAVSELGATTATSVFFRSLGGAVGVAVGGAILAAELHAHAGTADSPAAVAAAAVLGGGIDALAQLSPAAHDAVVALYRDAIGTVFYVGSGIAALAFLTVLFLPELPLKSRAPKPETGEPL